MKRVLTCELIHRMSCDNDRVYGKIKKTTREMFIDKSIEINGDFRTTINIVSTCHRHDRTIRIRFVERVDATLVRFVSV
jgi:hypothetical protein